jgi:EAL domain-containing protein (putative c-di-GMP-specific phosphodiesterase class I)
VLRKRRGLGEEEPLSVADAEVEALLNLGVSYGQGFFFAKPAPLAELSLEPSSRKRRAAAG